MYVTDINKHVLSNENICIVLIRSNPAGPLDLTFISLEFMTKRYIDQRDEIIHMIHLRHAGSLLHRQLFHSLNHARYLPEQQPLHFIWSKLSRNGLLGYCILVDHSNARIISADIIDEHCLSEFFLCILVY